jgi:hypothetical protein
MTDAARLAAVSAARPALILLPAPFTTGPIVPIIEYPQGDHADEIPATAATATSVAGRSPIVARLARSHAPADVIATPVARLRILDTATPQLHPPATITRNEQQ